MTTRSDWAGCRVIFDDERAVSDAGIALVATLAQRLESRRSRSGWSGCVGTGRALPTRAAR
jgi:hypothetical protein